MAKTPRDNQRKKKGRNAFADKANRENERGVAHFPGARNRLHPILAEEGGAKMSWKIMFGGKGGR